MAIQETLIGKIKRGQVVLFLGAGASFGSPNPNGDKIPMGDELRDLLCDQFLAGKEKNRTLEEVANFAENKSDRSEVDRWLSGLLRQFNPNQAISLLPEFLWRSIFSTNYDVLVERAYANASDPAQNLIKFHKDINGMDKQISSKQNPIPLYKLHGCIDELYQKDAPLVLSSSTYVEVLDNRPRMFNRLVDAASDYSVLFVGTRLADPHIKALLAGVEKSSGASRPLYYMLAPDLTENDESYLSSRRFQPIKSSFDNFMKELSEEIDPTSRRIYLSAPIEKHPIQQHFNQLSDVPPNLLSFVSRDVEFIHSGVQSTEVSADLFYKGNSASWSPIQQNYDFKRDVYEALMLRLLGIQKQKTSGVDAILLKGVAGAGKTVLSRRIAFDLAVEYNELVLFAPPGSNIRAEPLIELYKLTAKSAIIFVDQASDLATEIRHLVQTLDREKVPLTLVLIDTETAIGDRFSELDDIIKEQRTLRKMSDQEMVALLAILEKHGCLGQLERLESDARFRALAELADKQLLVALYEATQGRPLEDILLEEYHRILFDEAQELYLLVCTLHRFQVPVRAGLVRRIMGISYTDFQQRFLGPLTDLVFASMDARTRDYCYRTRHSQIANIVFSRVLDTQSKQVDQFVHIMRGINTSYSSDADALRKMINFYNLRDLVGSLAERRRILDIASAVAPDDPYILQQQAMLEMNSPKGDLSVAAKKLSEAQTIRPNDRTLRHSRANLLSRESQAADDWLTRQSLRVEARKILKELRSSGAGSAYVEGLLAKISNDEMEDRLSLQDQSKNSANSRDILRLAEDVEKALSKGAALNPDFDSLLREEVRLAQILGGQSSGIKILQAALDADPHSKYAALSYSRVLRTTEPNKAAELLREAMVPRPNDKQLNQALFEVLSSDENDFSVELKPILDKAFTLEDGNLNMHVRAMRYHFMRGEQESYERVRAAASKMDLDHTASFSPRFPVPPLERANSLWTGRIISLASTFGFLKVGVLMDNVFFSPRSCESDDVWDNIGVNTEVEFQLCFNTKGAVASKLRLKGN